MGVQGVADVDGRGELHPVDGEVGGGQAADAADGHAGGEVEGDAGADQDAAPLGLAAAVGVGVDGGDVSTEDGAEEVVEFGDGPAGAVFDDQAGGEFVVGEAHVLADPVPAERAVAAGQASSGAHEVRSASATSARAAVKKGVPRICPSTVVTEPPLAAAAATRARAWAIS